VTEVFHEVDAQLRAARFQMMVQRGWPYALGLAVVAALIALTAWGLSVHEQSQAATASEHYATATQLLQNNDTKGAEKELAVAAQNGSRAYRALALMQQAGLLEKADNAKGALALLDQAAQAAPNQLLADAARLEAAYIAMNIEPYDQVRARLLPLEDAGRPYRTLAKEALGMSELAAGKVAEAKGDLQVVSLSPDASDALHNRAAAALALIQSGAWTSLAPLAKASATLTPKAPAPSPGAGLLSQMQAAPQAGAAQ
jgi:hypothetical protein